jgi:membrane associated rhomboid family serine protease
MLRRGDTVFSPVMGTGDDLRRRRGDRFSPVMGDGDEPRRFPWMVVALMAVNGALWALQLREGETFTNALAAVPYELSTSTDVADTQWVSFGGRFVPIEHQPGPWPIHLTLVSSMFLHGSWPHLLVNMLFLILFGPPIENRTGPWRFFGFYGFCGVAAGIAHVLAGPQSFVPMVGASGAISGILGAYVLTFPLREVPWLVTRLLLGPIAPKLPAVVVFALWVLFQYLDYLSDTPGGSSGIAVMAHIGGFITGLLLAIFLVPNPPPPPERRYSHEEIST